MVNPEYSVVWKYVIHPEHREEFEHAYSSEGEWYAFFNNSPAYRGSILQRSEIDPDTYLLTDTWSDREAYESFINNPEYDALSRKYEYLYAVEERIGAFHRID